MAIDPISAAKFFSGLVQPKTHIKTFAFVIIALFWLFVGYGIYKAYFKKPLPTTAQEAEQIINYNTEPRQTFGCINFKIQKPTKPKGDEK